MSAQATLALIGRSCYAFLDTSSSAPVLFFFNQLEENGEGKISNQPRHTHAAITDLQHARWHLNHMTLNLEMWFLKLHFLHHLVELLHSSSTRTHGNILKKYRAFFPHWSHLQILRAPEPGKQEQHFIFFYKSSRAKLPGWFLVSLLKRHVHHIKCALLRAAHLSKGSNSHEWNRITGQLWNLYFKTTSVSSYH